MIEIRWYVPINGEKTLQYRQMIDTTIRAGIFNTAPANMQWSEWSNVPIKSERDPNYHEFNLL